MLLDNLCTPCKQIVDNLVASKVLQFHGDYISQQCEEVGSSVNSSKPACVSDCDFLESDSTMTIISTSESNDIDDQQDLLVNDEPESLERKVNKRKSSELVDSAASSVFSFGHRFGGKNSLIPVIKIRRLPNFMIDCDEPASELDQIYSSFTESLFMDGEDFKHRLMNVSRKQNHLAPIPASQVDPGSQKLKKMKQIDEIVEQMVVNNLENSHIDKMDKQSESIDWEVPPVISNQHGYKSSDEVEEMSNSLKVFFSQNPYYQTNKSHNQLTDVFREKLSISTSSSNGADFIDKRGNSSMVQPQKSVRVRIKTNKVIEMDKFHGSDKVYRCPFCTYKCLPEGRAYMIRHLNGRSFKGESIPPSCRKRKKLKPANPETGLYERLEPILGPI